MFGMGTGVAPPLWPPGRLGNDSTAKGAKNAKTTGDAGRLSPQLNRNR